MSRGQRLLQPPTYPLGDDIHQRLSFCNDTPVCVDLKPYYSTSDRSTYFGARRHVLSSGHPLSVLYILARASQLSISAAVDALSSAIFNFVSSIFCLAAPIDATYPLRAPPTSAFSLSRSDKACPHHQLLAIQATDIT